MRSRAIVVPLADGERTRQSLRAAGWLRTDLKIVRSPGEIALPVVAEAVVPPGGRAEEREFAAVAARGASSYADLLEWSAAEKELLPRSFDVVGDVVLVRVPPALEARSSEIGAALLGFVPGARIVGSDRGVHGPERRRTVERIAGAGGWRTRHRENGVTLDVDVELAYFSPRLAREHARVAEEVRPGERVYDLCCGVGPFAVTIARDGRARSVTAVDANPHAIELLRASLRRLTTATSVTPIAASIETFVATAPPVERVVLNLPHEGIKYLPSVARTVAPRGRLYYYEVVPRDALPNRSNDLATMLATEFPAPVVDPHLVHPYSPSADLVAFVIGRPA